VNEGGGDSFGTNGNRLYGVEVAEKGVFRFALRTTGRAGHASIPKIADNALAKLAPIVEAMTERRAEFDRSPEPDALIEALGFDSGDLGRALEEIESRDPRVALLLEPTLGVTFAPTMIRASEKINVIPARAEVRVDCRVPPGLGEEHARRRLTEVVGEDGYEVEFLEDVVGNRSPSEGPLMQHIREFVEQEEPGAQVVPLMLPGFTDSRWFREAFPSCTAYGFMPRREVDMFQAAALMHAVDERASVSDLVLGGRFFAELAPKVLG